MVSTIEQEVTTDSWNTIYGDSKYRKSGRTVFVNLHGSVNLRTIDNFGYVQNGSNQDFVLPEGYRSNEETYFFATRGGAVTNAPYLCGVMTNGKIVVYHRGDDVKYLFGNVCFSTY